MGDSLTLIDTSDAVVRQLARQLDQRGIVALSKNHPSALRLLSTGNADTLQAMAKRLLRSDLSKHRIETHTVRIE